MMRITKTFLLFVAIGYSLCSQAWAQETRFEAGGRVAGGNYGYMEDEDRSRVVVGAELCAYCSGKRALFAEYNHFFAPSSGGYREADLVAGGLRLQGGRKVRPFFEVGIAVGHSRFGITSTTSRTTIGAAIGAGVSIPVGSRFYSRPQFRLFPMSEQYLALSYGVGAGWRF
jgi:hypothetical protein